MTLPGLDTVGHHVRLAARLSPGRPAIWLGVRTALATLVPLLAVHMIHPVAAQWAPLAGFLVALADKGGAYRHRAMMMGSVAIGGLLAVLGGSLLAGHGLFSALIVTLALAMLALAQAWGPALVSVGNSIGVQLLVAASLPCAPTDALERSLGFAGGAAFALVLGLVVWPIRVYKPGGRAVSAVLEGLAGYARALAHTPDGDGRWRDETARRHRVLRDDIEVARFVLAQTRGGRRGETGRGARLLATLQICDALFGVLIGLEEALDAGCPPEARAIVVRGLGELADGLGEASRNVRVEHPLPGMRNTWKTHPPVPPEATGSDVDTALANHALALITRAHADRAGAAAVIESIAHDTEPVLATLPDPPMLKTFRDMLGEAIDPDGPVARHAVRVAVVVAAAMMVARTLDLSHRYWVTLTAFLLLTPLSATTRVRAIQRVTGTVVGGILAAAVPWLVDDPRVMVSLIVLLAGLSAAVAQLNYGLYAMLMTPTFVLLAEMHAQDIHLVGIRIANTLIGAGIVVIASVVWPARAATRFDDAIADAYLIAAGYLEDVIEAIIFEVPAPWPQLAGRRHVFGVDMNRADLALDHLAIERAPVEVTEPRMAQAMFLRRLASAIATLGASRHTAEYQQHHVELAAFGASAVASLHELAQHARRRAPLCARPRIDRPISDPVLAARIERIDAALSQLMNASLRSAPDLTPAPQVAAASM